MGSGGNGRLPEDAFSADAGRFSSWLESAGLDYLIVDESPGDRLRLRFVGGFEGGDVVWDCELLTLAAESRCLERAGKHVPAGGLRRFIEIGNPAGQGVPLRVGLELDCIDRPAIEKTIIMIRNYKRLHRGRHEYGGWHPVQP